jgi:hypothetical protein
MIDSNTFRSRASPFERVHLQNAVAEQASDNAQLADLLSIGTPQAYQESPYVPARIETGPHTLPVADVPTGRAG